VTNLILFIKVGLGSLGVFLCLMLWLHSMVRVYDDYKRFK
jgi:hypothetical protein